MEQIPEFLASLQNFGIAIKTDFENKLAKKVEERTINLKQELEHIKKINKLLDDRQAQHDREIQLLKAAHKQKLRKIKTMTLENKKFTEVLIELIDDEKPDGPIIVMPLSKSVEKDSLADGIDDIHTQAPIKRKRLFSENKSEPDDNKKKLLTTK